MSLEFEDKLKLYELKIEKYKKKIDEIEGGTFFNGIKMIIFNGEEVFDSVKNLIENNKYYTNDLIKLIGDKSYIIDLNTNIANVFTSKIKVSMSFKCNIIDAVDTILKNLKDDAPKDIKKNIMSNLKELPNKITLKTKLTEDDDSFNHIFNELSDIFSQFNSYAVINFGTLGNKKRKLFKRD